MLCPALAWPFGMKRRDPFKYFKTNPEIIRLAVMLFIRFPLSLRDVEDLLHERGIDVSPRPTFGMRLFCGPQPYLSPAECLFNFVRRPLSHDCSIASHRTV